LYYSAVVETLARVAVVTGAGSGIGRATSVRLAADGLCVVVTDVDEGSARATASMLVDAGHVAVSHRLDVTSSADVDECVARVLVDHGRLDVVVNNAGVLDNMGTIEEISDDEWSRVLAVNLTGPFNVSRRVIAPLLASGGNIVNIASIGGLAGGRAGTAYTVSKHGVIGLTRSIAWMHATDGIRCNAICPGGVATNIGSSASGMSEAGIGRLSGVLATMLRTGAPEEIADAVAFLSSAQASFINGAVLVADGGWIVG
jgi:NAD(P)-dependent dehydrogenase (short-subunit alcohol dehydrogenase family)